MKRSGPLARRTPLRHTRPVRRRNVKRHASEWARAYHSRVRVQWIVAQPCIVHGESCSGPIENAHTENGGMSRKGDYWTIVPLCRALHRLLHRIGVASFEREYRIDLKAEASRTHARAPLFSGGAA